jgi:hypothetical protein
MAKLLKKNIGEFLKSLLTNWLEDFLIFAGVSIILLTTYQIFGLDIGNYSLGLILLIFGLVIAKK